MPEENKRLAFPDHRSGSVGQPLVRGQLKGGELRGFQLSGTLAHWRERVEDYISKGRVALLSGWQPVTSRTEVLSRFRSLTLAPA